MNLFIKHVSYIKLIICYQSERHVELTPSRYVYLKTETKYESWLAVTHSVNKEWERSYQTGV